MFTEILERWVGCKIFKTLISNDYNELTSKEETNVFIQENALGQHFIDEVLLMDGQLGLRYVLL